MKLKTALLLFVFLYCAPAFSQDLQQPATVEANRFKAGINFSPDYCYRNVINNNGSASSAMIADLRDKDEIGKFGYTTGLNLSYKINKRFGIEAGLQYSNKGYAMSKTDLFFGDQIDPRYGFVYDTIAVKPSKAKFIYSFHYLDIPVRVFVILGERKLKFISGIGITTNILLNATQTSIVEYEDGETDRQTRDQPYDYNTINISPTVSAGIEYRINSVFDLRAEPTFRYGVLKLSDTPVSNYLWSCGMNISCYYRLK